jgi:hypothetical protein
MSTTREQVLRRVSTLLLEVHYKTARSGSKSKAADDPFGSQDPPREVFKPPHTNPGYVAGSVRAPGIPTSAAPPAPRRRTPQGTGSRPRRSGDTEAQRGPLNAQRTDLRSAAMGLHGGAFFEALADAASAAYE